MECGELLGSGAEVQGGVLGAAEEGGGGDGLQGSGGREAAELGEAGGGVAIEGEAEGGVKAGGACGGFEGEAGSGAAQIKHGDFAIGSHQADSWGCGCGGDGVVNGRDEGREAGELLGADGSGEGFGFDPRAAADRAGHRQIEGEGRAELAVKEILGSGGKGLYRQAGGIAREVDGGGIEGHRAAAGVGGIAATEQDLGEGGEADAVIGRGGCGGRDREGIAGDQVAEEPGGPGSGDRHGGCGHPGTGHDEIGLGATGARGATAEDQGIGGVTADAEGEAGGGGRIENDVGGLQGGAAHAGGAGARAFHGAGSGCVASGVEGA